MKNVFTFIFPTVNSRIDEQTKEVSICVRDGFSVKIWNYMNAAFGSVKLPSRSENRIVRTSCKSYKDKVRE